ncbi:MAG: histidine kinase [Actinomycetota bacterium]|nr:histidine kinase [Actinomycetota bacterium]
MNVLAGTRRSADVRRSLPETVIAGIAAVMIMLEVWVFDPGGWTAARTVAGLAAALALAFLRTAPFAAYLANGVALFALTSLGFPSDYYQWTNLVAIIAVASRAALAPALVCLAVSYAGIAYYFLRFPDEGPPALAGALLAMWAAAWFGGRAVRARSRETAARQENKVARAELAAQQSRDDLESERSRIAQELHDVVGHAVNVMVVHAGAGQGISCADPKAREIFTTIATTGRGALADLDRMLDLLHGKAVRDPLPGLAELSELCSTVRSTGLDVQLSIADAVKEAAPSVGLTTYRIVQEALTNVMKHADATAVRVEVSAGPSGDKGEISISVRDNGTGGQPVPGRGLGSIAARAALHGGSARYGPADDDAGFEVSARLPASTAMS